MWYQDAHLPEIKKNAMLLYFYEICNFSIIFIGNVDRHIYNITRVSMGSELVMCSIL